MMDIIKKFRIYLPFTLTQIKARMSYRIAFYTFLLSEAFSVLVIYYLWKAIYSSSPNTVLGGFTFSEMVTYVIISFFTANAIDSVGTNSIAYEITDGSIAISLIKPINYKFKVLSEAIGNLLFSTVIVNFPFWLLISLFRAEPIPSITTLLLYVLSTCLSFFIMFLFGFCFAMLAFYTTYFFGLNIAKDVIIRFLSGSLIPLAFFPSPIQNMFRFLPFASMNYTPVMVYLGKLSGNAAFTAMLQQVIWVILLYFLSEVLWKKAIKRLTILGG